jgi:hypothetical protein
MLEITQNWKQRTDYSRKEREKKIPKLKTMRPALT